MVCCPPAKLALAVVVLIVALVGTVKSTVPPRLRVMAPRLSVVPVPPLVLTTTAEAPGFRVRALTVWLVAPLVLPTRSKVPPPRVRVELLLRLPAVPLPTFSVPPLTVVAPV